MRVLLTGSTGLLGTTLARYLNEKGHEVIPFKGKLEDPAAGKKYTGPYDWVVHTAAMTDTKACEINQELCWQVNALGTRTMCEVAKNSGAKFLYISTVSVFSGVKGGSKESDLPYPQGFYNLSKFAGELYAAEYKLTTIVRLNMIGIHEKGSRGTSLVEWLVRSYSTNANINLFTDVVINPLSPMTIAEQLEKILTVKKQEPILHLTSSNRLSKAAIGKLVQKHFPKYQGTITETTSAVRDIPTPKEIWLNSDQTAKWLVIKRPSIEEEIEKIFKAYKK